MENFKHLGTLPQNMRDKMPGQEYIDKFNMLTEDRKSWVMVQCGINQYYTADNKQVPDISQIDANYFKGDSRVTFNLDDDSSHKEIFKMVVDRA